jgi:hypothetical protein
MVFKFVGECVHTILSHTSLTGDKKQSGHVNSRRHLVDTYDPCPATRLPTINDHWSNYMWSCVLRNLAL